MGFDTNCRDMERANQFVGQSLAFLDAVERASRAAPLNRPVLVIGERGTGKELIAERLHHLSGRWAGPLVVMNCAALPENLIEAELFGHEAGSFTGASKTRHGRFEEADGGTLFLDELGTLSKPAQDRLLRAVEYGEITRIGASKPIQVDVRIVAASNENLPTQVDKGHFRADLLDRLSFEVVTLPPLRSRSGDIPLLVDHFGRRMAVELEWTNWPGFSPRALSELEDYQLARQRPRAQERGRARRLSVGGSGASGRGDPVRPFPFALGSVGNGPTRRPRRSRTGSQSPRRKGRRRPHRPSSTSDFRAAVSDYERALLQNALAANRFNQRATASALNLSYDQLRHALKRHKLLETDAA